MKFSLARWGGILGIIGQIVLQLNSLVKTDTIWAEEVALRMINGGSYVESYFENNPPLIFFLHIITRTVANLLHIPPVVGWYGFILVGSFISLLIVDNILKKVFRQDATTHLALIIGLLIALFVVPSISFGQREQVMFFMTIPYFFSLLARLFNMPFSSKQLASYGLMAAIGLGLKPYFFIPVCLLELFYLVFLDSKASCYKLRIIAAWFRIDLLIIIVIQFLYLLSIVYLTPTYFSAIFPLALTVYSKYQLLSLSFLALVDPMLFFYAVALFGGIAAWRYQTLSKTILFFLTMALGFALSFLAQSKGFDYHAMPLISATTLALMPLLVALWRSRQQQRYYITHAVFCFELILIGLCCGYGQFFYIVYQNLSCAQHPKYCGARVIEMWAKQGLIKGSFFSFSQKMSLNMIGMYYGNVEFASRFPNYWLLPAMQGQFGNRRQNEIRKMLIEDFQTYKPQAVIIDYCPYEAGTVSYADFNFLNFMLQDSAFKSIWQHYQFKQTSPLQDCLHLYTQYP